MQASSEPQNPSSAPCAPWWVYWPTILAVLIYIGLLWLLWYNYIPYLSDILNASTVAEVGGGVFNMGIGPLKECILLGALFSLVLWQRWRWVLLALSVFFLTAWLLPAHDSLYHISWEWLLILVVTLTVWLFWFQVLRLLNIGLISLYQTHPELLTPWTTTCLVGKAGERRFQLPPRHQLHGEVERSLYAILCYRSWLAVKPPPGSAEGTPIPIRGNTTGRQFLWLFVLIWITASLPAWVSIALLYYSPEPIGNVSLMAATGVFSLLNLFSLSPALACLGRFALVRWWVRSPAWSPIVVFLIFVSANNPLEMGQGIANRGKTDGLWPFNNWNSGYHTSDANADSAMQRQRQQGRTPQMLFPATGPEPYYDPGPLVIICASGGGSRAALFTAGIFCRMWQEPLPNNAQTFPGRILLQEADIISGVSGGSLAAAYFVESLYREMESSKRQNTSLSHKEILDLREAALKKFFGQTNAKQARPAVQWYGMEPPHLPTLENAFAPCHSVEDFTEARLQTFDTHAYLNAMRQNYVAATLSGFFSPFVEGRALSYENAWASNFDWYSPARLPKERERDYRRRRLQRRLFDFYDLERDGRIPHLILNATLTRTGSRLAFTNLDQTEFTVTSGFDASSQVGEEDAEKLLPKFGPPSYLPTDMSQTERYDPLPDRILTLNYLAPDWNIALKTALHASANFPYALPTIRFQDTLPHRAEKHNHIWEALDGGGIDNYGIDSVIALLRTHAKEVRRRGVLLFQVDAGWMDVDRGSGHPHHFAEARNAWWRGDQNRELALSSLYIRELQTIFGGVEVRPISIRVPDLDNTSKPTPWVVGYKSRDLPKKGQKGTSSAPGFAYFKVRAGEKAKEQVLTYWHLNDHERKILYHDLCAVQQGVTIRAAADWLQSRLKTQNASHRGLSLPQPNPKTRP